MPSRVTDQTQWRHERPGLRWAREDSGDLIGNSGQRPSPARDRRARERGARRTVPARLAGGRPRHDITSEQNHLEDPPPGHVRKKLEPDVAQATIRAAVISFEWIAQGFTAQSFWTAPNRLAR